jgi:hypothetical protein
MTLTNLQLKGPIQYLIIYRKRVFDKYADNYYGSAIVEATIK